MFKKVKKSNGIREFYCCGKKIFQYVNSAKFAEFVERRFDTIATRQDLEQSFDLIYDISMGGGGNRPQQRESSH